MFEGFREAPRLSFNRDIRPILSENCFACHGPDSAKRQAGLRLDVREAAVAELDSGTRAIVPEDAAASELVARILSDDPDAVMPPPEAKLGRLSPEQVATLQRWIAEGAVYEPHWAFIPPAKPTPPADAVTNPIDGIVTEKLAARGLALQPEADRATLIRRATFDLTGLPPTPEEVAAFVADTAPDAYEKVLDRLLASPRYGERMAADWMDLARYADSYGFQIDRDRPDMWPWRDWVIKAFNENLPWDRFVTWQLAGDLLPNATDEQILATAFNRLHPQEAEGGSVEEEYRVNYVNDRTTTFGTAFLGLTLECCRCHDHKFDPLPQREYYQLFAFFDDVDEAGLYSVFTSAIPTPKLRLLDDRARDALTKAEESCGEKEAAAGQAAAAATARVAEWIAGKAEPHPALTTLDDAGRLKGEVVRYAFDERDKDGKFANSAADAPADQDRRASAPGEIALADGHSGKAVALTGDHPVNTPVGNFRRSHPFTVAAWIRAASPADRAVVFHRSRAWTDAASRGYELLIDKGHLQWSLIHFWPGDAASVRTAEPLSRGRWVHVAVTSDGSGKAAGLEVFVDGKPAAANVVRDCLSREITGGGGDTITIGERFRDHGFTGGLVDDFRVFDRALAPLEVCELVEPGTLAACLRDRSDPEALGGWFAAAIDEDATAAGKALEDARRHRDDLAEGVREIMVMRELPQPKTAHVLERGDYDKRGAAVEPGTPAALPPFPADQPRNRLGLARWLTAPDHPLLARVTVNRLWQALFGTGLVSSSEDLGSQSARPEYPEVLDLLAWRFSHPMAEGGLAWDMKALVKAIMTSQIYRQRSIADAQTMVDDPQNVWLARGPRPRTRPRKNPSRHARRAARMVSGAARRRQEARRPRPDEAPRGARSSRGGRRGERRERDHELRRLRGEALMADGMNRRDWLHSFGMGFGGLALAEMLGRTAGAEPAPGLVLPAGSTGGALGAFHVPPKAKRVIYLFQSGGPSQLDLFDHKPLLAQRDGEQLPDSVRRGQRLTGMSGTQSSIPLAASPWKFARHGDGGAEISELLPHTAQIADRLCIVRSMYTESINHGPGVTFMQSGSQIPGRPSIGAWLDYGLGNVQDDLPSFVVLVTKNKGGQPLMSHLWGAGFLPTKHQAVRFRSGGDPVLYVSNPPGVSAESRRKALDGLKALHEHQFAALPDAEIAARIANYEMAFRMQASVPDVTNLADEPQHVIDRFGPESKDPGTFAANCLLARRLAERGVRFIQLYHQDWDHHGGIKGGLTSECRQTDRASAVLVQDLADRGMLDDTLVVWGGECGRTNYCQGLYKPGQDFGRDHHPRCFTIWMAGGGVKPGITWGETDEWGYNLVKDGVHVHDFHATLLHLLGIDHERLTYKFQGRRYRLTDVHGKVVTGILA